MSIGYGPEPFDTTASAIANAQGVATATIGPIPLGQTWRIDRTSVNSNSVLRSTAAIYRNLVTPGQFIDRTLGGGNGDSSAIAYRLRSGEKALVQWTGCTPGAQCVVTAVGVLE